MAYLLRFGWLAALMLVWGCERDPVETLATDYDNRQVVVRFYGERSSNALFGEKTFLDLIQPVDASGEARGEIHRASPDWLAFDYQIDGERKRVLVAKQPVSHTVAWWDIARAGAADGQARVKDLDGTEYRVRLLHCGQHTMDELSEWNLLIGGVHQGDMDFLGERYGWIRRPYDNSDLKVGYQGSLSWCQDRYSQNRRVMRGYYFVSRFHAGQPGFRGNRVFWRPVLEVVSPEEVSGGTSGEAVERPEKQRSPDDQVRYYGTVSNDELLGSGAKIADLVNFHDGKEHETGAPDWLRFHYRGQTLLVAAHAVRHSLSWDALARAGLVAGEKRKVRVGMRRYDQDVTVTDTEGNRYWVRLIQCGKSTLDHDSEWNRLIGGVVQPDGDFARFPSRYGWLDEPFEPAALNIHTDRGAATWCRENVSIYGDEHGVNRGFMVPSRFHATPSDFTGWGFGWRPVLQLIDED